MPSASAILTCLLVSAASRAEAPTEPHEMTIVPLLGGDSDVGFGGGYILSYARLPRGYWPYLWRLEAAGAATFKPGDDGGLQMPYLDDYVLLHLPHVIWSKLELKLRLSYTREATLKFAGLGNASRLAPRLDSVHRSSKHARTHPTLRWSALYHVDHGLDITWGAAYTHNWLDVPEDTLLAQKMRAGTDDERSLLGDARTQGNVQFSVGAAYDTRDNETNPRAGQYHLGRADLASGGTREIPNRWARVWLATHVYVPLLPERLTFAARVASDLLLGPAPFFELPRLDDTFFGGGNGIRGVPGQRYWGKVKILSNLELRSELLPFHFWHKRNVLGVTAFFDFGRLWTGFSSHPGLDGPLPGLKFGTGLGLRVAAGSSFVVRADFAYSPDAYPIGAYITSGHMF
ncbi:MAG TPA: BamA/TamA family outer membrane protein [Polyangiaceae bacterium]|nr:BamA/TamA family outer membrane protein [Polyangiaceae bacterium]